MILQILLSVAADSLASSCARTRNSRRAKDTVKTRQEGEGPGATSIIFLLVIFHFFSKATLLRAR